MDKFKKNVPLAMALDEFIARGPVYFCTPGHRFEKGISDELSDRFGEGVFRYDLTETYGLDDLHSPAILDRSVVSVRIRRRILFKTISILQNNRQFPDLVFFQPSVKTIEGYKTLVDCII